MGVALYFIAADSLSMNCAEFEYDSNHLFFHSKKTNGEQLMDVASYFPAMDSLSMNCAEFEYDSKYLFFRSLFGLIGQTTAGQDDGYATVFSNIIVLH